MDRQISISDTLRQAARDSGQGIRPLARAAGMDPATLLRFLRGKPVRTDQADKLAATLNLELRPRRQR